jgi:hypothetical protein
MVTHFSKGKQNQKIKKPQGIPNPMSKRLYTLKEGGVYLGRSTWAMRELIWAGEIPIVRQGRGRKIFVDILDLMAYIDRNKSTYL